MDSESIIAGEAEGARPTLIPYGSERTPLHPSIPKAVREATYLTAPNAERYRVIIHFFYERYKVQHHRLKPREVWTYVRDVYDPEYAIEQCALDLKSLSTFGTLAQEQDRDSVATIEEWRNRDFVYDITPLAIRLERALEVHRAEGGRRASLDPTLIESIAAELKELDRTLAMLTPAQERDRDFVRRNVRRRWRNIWGQFTELTQTTSDFHHALRDAHPHDLNEIQAFQIYKTVLIENLSSFINSLLDASQGIGHLMQSWVVDRTDLRLVTLLATNEAGFFDAGQTTPEEGDEPAADPLAHYGEQVAAVSRWFRYGGGNDALRRTTRSAIETVARVTARITDRMRAGSSRRGDLVTLARAFAACTDPADAHRLAALTMGSPTSHHIQGAAEWSLMTDTRSVWEQPASEVILRRIVRGAKPRRRAQPVADRADEQMALLREEQEREAAEEAAWQALFSAGPIDTTDLRLADPALRDRILDAIDNCFLTEDLLATTPDGTKLRLVPPTADEPPGRIVAPDGVFFTPRYRLVQEGAGTP